MQAHAVDAEVARREKVAEVCAALGTARLGRNRRRADASRQRVSEGGPACARVVQVARVEEGVAAAAAREAAGGGLGPGQASVRRGLRARRVRHAHAVEQCRIARRHVGRRHAARGGAWQRVGARLHRCRLVRARRCTHHRSPRPAPHGPCGTVRTRSTSRQGREQGTQMPGRTKLDEFEPRAHEFQVAV